MRTDSNCPICQAELPPHFHNGSCPKCLLIGGLEVVKQQLGQAESLQTAGAQMALASAMPRYFGDYELLEEIARGGMGVVFKARHLTLNRLVALKLIGAGALANDDLVKRFKVEAEAAASLAHPNIVPVFEIGEHQGQHYFSMALIQGPDLRQALAPKSANPRADFPVALSQPASAARLLSTLARSVHYAHSRGVLHRDIKPGNVLLDADGQPHLTDFGLAKLLEQDSTLTRTNGLLGTPAYMAPEQARGDTANITIATDVYGLGAVLYETLTGVPPFVGSASAETIRQVLDEEPRRPSLANPAVDRDLETICLRCLEKDAARRYSSAGALADDLDRWLRHEPIQARPTTRWERAQKWAYRRPAIAGLSCLLALAIVSGFAFSTWQWRDQVRHRLLAEREQSRTQVRLAESMLQSSGMKRARETLVAVPDQFRHWEWGYVLGQSVLPMQTLTGHSSLVQAASFSSDGNQLVTGDGDGVVKVWDLPHGTARLSLPTRLDIAAVAFNAELNQVVVWSNDGAGAVWDAATGTALRGFPPVPNLAFGGLSADGRRFFVATESGLQIYDTGSGLELKSAIQFPPRHRGAVLSADGRRIALASTQNLAIHDVETGRLLCNIPLEIPPRPALAFSPEGREILCSSAKGTLILFNAQTGARLRETPLLPDIGNITAQISRGAQWLAIRDSGRGVEIWDGRTFQKLRRYIWDEYDLFLNAISPDGQWIASGSTGNEVRLWPVKIDDRPLPHPATLTATALSSAETTLATGCEDGTVTLWDTATGTRLWSAREHFQWVTDIAFSPDEKVIATAGYDRTVRLWNVSSGATLGVIEQDTPVQSVIFHPDGRRLFTAGSDGAVRVWDPNQRVELERFSLHTSPIRRMILSLDGRLLAVGARDGRTKVFDLESRNEVPFHLPKQDTTISALAFNKAATRLAVSSGMRTEIWEVPSGRFLQRVDTHGVCGGVAFSPDDQRLFTASGCPAHERGNSGIEIWDMNDGKQLMFLREKGIAVLAAAFTADRRRFYVGGDSAAVSVWEALPWRAHDYAGNASETFHDRLDRFFNAPPEIAPAGKPDSMESEESPLPLRHPRSAWPKRDAATPPSALDLTEHYNARLDVTWTSLSDPTRPANDLASLPPGTLALHGNPFDVRGLIQLAAHREIASVYPEAATGIPVDRKCERIHFLHGASEVRAAAGTQVAAYVFHYADGTRAELPVILGRDLADWLGNPTGSITASEASEAWTGSNPAIAGMPQRGYIRLFLSTRSNPFPEKQIATIDFVSARVKAAPFVVAISLE